MNTFLTMLICMSEYLGIVLLFKECSRGSLKCFLQMLSLKDYDGQGKCELILSKKSKKKVNRKNVFVFLR